MRDRRKERDRAHNRHRLLFGVLRFLVGWFFCLRFNYKCEKVRLGKTPTIVLMNHNSDYDPIFAGIAFRGYMYFVASEHILRMGIFSKFIKFVFDPILRVKGTTEARAAMEILKTLRSGRNVCLFAEGNRSFNGETGAILPATGKLVKRSGAALVTYILRGGYHSTPRWGKGIRRGLVKGELVNTYSSEEIALMDDKEINKRIAEDLYVNAVDDQERFKIRYKGKKKTRALGIEIAVYTCPDCGSTGTLRSENDTLRCECGLDMRYTQYGTFEPLSGKGRFTNPLEWDRWQKAALLDRLSSSDDTGEVILSDDAQTLYEVFAEDEKVIIYGRICLFRDRLTITDNDGGGMTFPLSEIDDIEVTGRMTISFAATDKRNFEIRSDHPRSASKYRESFRILTGKHLTER